jgi:ribonuclease D
MKILKKIHGKIQGVFNKKKRIDWNPSYTLVDTTEKAKAMVADLKRESSCELDTEADSMHHYSTRLCLIQVSAGGKHWLVDPLSDANIAPMWRTGAMKNITLHGADYDLRMLGSHYGFYPPKIHDTMIAAKFLGEEHFGLAYLVEKYFNYKLKKENQTADWTIRPLPPQMSDYAVFDTVCLSALREMQEAALRKKGRLEWLEQTCQQLTRSARDFNKKVDAIEDEPWRSIKGTKKFSAAEFNMLRALWFWREKEAEALDRPTYKMLGPHTMIDIAITCAQGGSAIHLADLPRLPRNFKGDRLESFLDTINRARKAPKSSWPNPTPPPPPRGESPNPQLMEKLHALREKKSAERALDWSMIANRVQLTHLAARGDTTWDERFTKAGLMPWQQELWLSMLGGV